MIASLSASLSEFPHLPPHAASKHHVRSEPVCMWSCRLGSPFWDPSPISFALLACGGLSLRQVEESLLSFASLTPVLTDMIVAFPSGLDLMKPCGRTNTTKWNS
jgi:hypothetical protein